MTAILALLRVAWPYIASLGIGLGIGGYLVGNRWEARYNGLQSSFSKYQADVAKNDAIAQQTAREAVQKQINARLDAEKRNGEITQQLHDTTQARDDAARDAQFVRRLLAAAQAGVPAAPGHSGTAAVDKPGATDVAQPSGDRSVARLLETATAEARQCFQQYNALLAELGPQLGR